MQTGLKPLICWKVERVRAELVCAKIAREKWNRTSAVENRAEVERRMVACCVMISRLQDDVRAELFSATTIAMSDQDIREELKSGFARCLDWL